VQHVDDAERSSHHPFLTKDVLASYVTLPAARPSHRCLGANRDGSLFRSLRVTPKDEGEERPAVSLLVPESPRSSNNFQHRVSRLSEVNGAAPKFGRCG
jgi:hypothetical protein